MINTICDNDGILKAVERASQLEEKREYRRFLAEARKLTPWINSVAESVDDSWFDMPVNQRRELVRIRKILEELFERIEPPKSTWEAIKLFFASNLVQAYELMPYIKANVHFFFAMNRALERESQRQRSVEQVAGNDPNRLTELNQSHERAKQGNLSREYTYKEFLSRSSG